MGQQPTQGPPKPEPTMKGNFFIYPRASQIIHHSDQSDQT
jgi:hypothetical protein